MKKQKERFFESLILLATEAVEDYFKLFDGKVPEDFAVLGVSLTYVESSKRAEKTWRDYLGWFLIVSERSLQDGLEAEARQIESSLRSSLVNCGFVSEPEVWMVTKIDNAETIQSELESGALKIKDSRQYQIHFFKNKSG